MSISKFVTMISILSINQLSNLASQRIELGPEREFAILLMSQQLLPLIELLTTTIGNLEELPLSSLQKEKVLIPIVCPQVSGLKPELQ